MNLLLPVRSADIKHCTGGLVVRWVTTSESPLLYVFAGFLILNATELDFESCDNFFPYANIYALQPIIRRTLALAETESIIM
jgi:hypothetical protein